MCALKRGPAQHREAELLAVASVAANAAANAAATAAKGAYRGAPPSRATSDNSCPSCCCGAKGSHPSEPPPGDVCVLWKKDGERGESPSSSSGDSTLRWFCSSCSAAWSWRLR